jgi:hypothetical protein
MMTSRGLGVAVLGVMLTGSAVRGQSAWQYRNFQLGGDLASVTAVTGTRASDAKTVYARPAIVQELEWRRPYVVSGGTLVDPVQQIAFSFYNDQLFRLVIDYDRDRTEGMTDADMIEAITAMYGTPIKHVAKATGAPLPIIDDEPGTRVADWGSAESTAVLYRSSYASGFRMVVASVRLSGLARTAKAEARRLDERDAPERERARQKKAADEARASREKARLANKATFTP